MASKASLLLSLYEDCELITYTNIIGNAAQASFSEQLHHLEHENKVDYLTLSSDDIQRKRLKAFSSTGKECGIALARDQKLYGGAILHLADDYALVVRSTDAQWLRCRPKDAAAALELGYFAGNMHWSVRFQGEILEIEIKGKVEDYQERLTHLLSAGRIMLESDNG
jgi:urease accessory protein